MPDNKEDRSPQEPASGKNWFYFTGRRPSERSINVLIVVSGLLLIVSLVLLIVLSAYHLLPNIGEASSSLAL